MWDLVIYIISLNCYGSQMKELIIAGHVAWIREISAYSVLVGKPLGKCPPTRRYVDDIDALTAGVAPKMFNAEY